MQAAYAEALSDLASLAALAADAPIAIITRRVGDADTEAIETAVGCDAAHIAMVVQAVIAGLCSAADGETELHVVPDAQRDVRLADAVTLSAPLTLRFVIAAPIVGASGARLGTLLILAGDARNSAQRETAMVRAIRSRIGAEMEVRVRADEERAAILERVTDAFMALDVDGCFTWANEKAAATFGGSSAAMLGRNIWHEFGQTVTPRFRSACEQVMRDQKPVTIDDCFEPRDRWYEGRIFPSRTGLSIFFRDITERKRADAALNLSEARFRELVEQGADVVFMMDTDGVITWCSPSVQRVLGYTATDVRGRMGPLLVHPDDRESAVAAFHEAMSRPGHGATVEFRVQHRDGSLRMIRGHGVNRFDDPMFGAFVASWHDVTEQREAERVLLNAADQLRRLTQRNQQVRDEEQAHLSRELHDRLGQSLTMLRIGLSRVSGALVDTAPEAAAQTAELITDIDAAIHATRQISADLRPPLLDDFGLAAALEWAGQRFASRSGIACRTEVEESDLPPEVARAMYAITQEALTNIVRHAKAKAVVIRLAARASGVQLDVTDDGVGIAWSATGADNGSLGLLGMRERATAVGATVVVYPGSNGGTTVSIRRPAAVAEVVA
jgi:two-component system, NarL family, sensor histidine kinase UhpB